MNMCPALYKIVLVDTIAAYVSLFGQGLDEPKI
jgi:hypothetical protein